MPDNIFTQDGTAYSSSGARQYCTVGQLKTRLDITDSDDDAALLSAVIAASAAVENYCSRRFDVGAAGVVRYYTARNGHELLVDDLIAVSALATDDDGDRTYETTWAATDYDLEPINAAADGLPYQWIATAPNGDHSFPFGARGVKITGQWGWPETPQQVVEATLLMASRLWKRTDTPYGLAGSAEFGMTRISASDPDVRALLDPLRRIVHG